jgi:endonuclease VIII
MPEGDTVWLAGRRLHDALAGDRLTRSDFRVPQLATTDLAGRTVTEVVSRGKHLLTRVDDDLTLHTHFRMDGTWHLYRPGDRWRGGPQWQVRVLLETAAWQAVGYRLPVVELLPRDREDDAVGHLGPDILGPDWDPAEAVRRLAAQPDREVGDALLDQRNLAGIGNLYKAESLFLAARVHGSVTSPTCPAWSTGPRGCSTRTAPPPPR